jgi:hypothetical protein
MDYKEDNYRYDKNCTMCEEPNSLVTIGQKLVSSVLVEQTIKIQSCNICGHWQTYPTPNRLFLKKLYSNKDFSVYPEKWLEGCKESKKSYKVPKSWILKELAGIKIGKSIDVGSGDGALVNHLGNLGWDSYGVDFGKFTNIENIFNDYTNIPTGLKFDLMIFEDVVEHFSEPKVELKMYTSFLNKRAIVLISIPFSKSKRAQKTKTDWNTCVPLGHINFFSLESLSFLLDHCDLELLNVKICSDEKNFSSFIQFLRLIITFPIQIKEGFSLAPYRDRIKLLKQFYYLWSSPGDWIQAKCYYRGNN